MDHSLGSRQFAFHGAAAHRISRFVMLDNAFLCPPPSLVRVIFFLCTRYRGQKLDYTQPKPYLELWELRFELPIRPAHNSNECVANEIRTQATNSNSISVSYRIVHPSLYSVVACYSISFR